MKTSEQLYDVEIRYKLKGGDTISELYLQDIPKEVWRSITEKVRDSSILIEIVPADWPDETERLLFLKENLLHISLRVVKT